MGLRRAGEGLAEVLHWADEAHWFSRCAYRRPEIHQCLIKIIYLASRNERLRQLPEGLLEAVAFRISLANENPVQHTADVGVEDRGLAAKRKAQHGSSRIAPDAFQALQSLRIIGNLPAVFLDGLSCDAMQAQRPDIIAQRVLGLSYLVDRSIGQRFEGRIFLQEFFILGDDTIDLGLL
jgi:hypothetical protein